MSPSPKKKLSKFVGKLSPSREKISRAVQRVSAAADNLAHHGYPCSSTSKDTAPCPPDRQPAFYDEIGSLISDPGDDKTMPLVFSNRWRTLSDASVKDKSPNCGSYVRAYKPRVSFDTSDDKNITDFSFSMASKHKDYQYTARSRTFLCGTDENDYSEFALEWLLEELVEENDEIICLRVVNPETKTNIEASVLQETYRDEAKRLLDHFQEKNENKTPINLIVELAVGKVEEVIQAMIKTYNPASLIVGTKGKPLGGIQGLRKGSVSRYCLQNSPIPVVVVRPKDKRMKKKLRRSQDPKRQNYKAILEQSNASGFDALAQAQQSDALGTETEANAVAKAIGLDEEDTGLGPGNERPSSAERSQLSRLAQTRMASGRNDSTYETESPSPTGPLLVIDDEGAEVTEMQLPETVEEDKQVVAMSSGSKVEERDVGEGNDGIKGADKAVEDPGKGDDRA